MRNKLTIFLLVILVITATYSLMALHTDSDEESGMLIINGGGKSNSSPSNRGVNERLNVNSLAQQRPQQLKKKVKQTNKVKDGEIGLPFPIKLLGVDLENSLALFEALGELKEYRIGEDIFDLPITFSDLKAELAILNFEAANYEITLEGLNLLKKEKPKTYEELLAMTPQQVGTRPKLVEHFVSLTKTPFLADGMIAAPGINPKLFKQAGLEEDDVLKTINGLSVTIDHEFERIQRLMPLANTLVLVVERRGRKLTLYLDIPGEDLQLKR